MRFMMGEGIWSWLERASYRGGIGIYWNNTFGGIISYIVFALVVILAIIGLCTVIGWLFKGRSRKSKETPGEKWLRTGKM